MNLRAEAAKVLASIEEVADLLEGKASEADAAFLLDMRTALIKYLSSKEE